MSRRLPNDEMIRWVATWREAGAALERQRRTELERLETPAALAALAAAFDHAQRRNHTSDSSGLVEQQRYFQRLR
jgi:hypothetical protein